MSNSTNATKLRIRIWPDKILKKRCRRIDKVTEETRRLFDQMHELMKETDGVGLAGNQAGVRDSLIVVEAGDKLFKLVNARITRKEGKLDFDEGCLSFPGMNLTIRRASKIWIQALDEYGNPFDIEAEGTLAVIFQHEIDHVNGVVFIERVPFWQRWKLRPQLKKIRRIS